MTVNTTNITSGPYIGNGASDTYSYTFRVADKTQLSVYETTDAGNQSLLVVDTDYTVTGVGVDAGGTVVRTAGNLPTDYQWYIRSNYIENQLTAFASQGGFFPDVHEAQMDHITFLIQQLRDALVRSFKLSDTIDIDGDFTIGDDATTRANNVLSFDSSGNLVIGVALQDWVDAAEDWAINPEDTPVPIASGGDGASTFSALHWAAKALAVETAAAELSQFEYTASAGQTVFSGADDNANVLAYDVGSIVVFVQGSRLQSSEYAATDGTSVTLVTPVNLNDTVSFQSFGTFALTSSYTKQEIDGSAAITPNIDGGTMSDVTVDGDLTANSETITPTKLGYLNDVTSDIQAQLAAIAASASFKGALVYNSANQSITTSGTAQELTFDSESYDTNGIHDTVTNNTRLTVPTGVTKVRLVAKSTFAANTVGYRNLQIRKNGSAVFDGYVSEQFNAVSDDSVFTILSVSSPVLVVVATDYFECTVVQTSGGALNAQGNSSATWFSMEIVE